MQLTPILIVLLGLTIASCESTTSSPEPVKTQRGSLVRLTVVSIDNQNPGYQVVTDTLIRDSLIDLSQTKIDLYFTHTIFLFPYYMPTGGMFKNPAQEKECDWSIYPRLVKCYAYDRHNRVIRMQAEGSGTMGSTFYNYDRMNRVTRITGDGETVIIYNPDNTIKEIRHNNFLLGKQFKFYYR